MRLRYELALVLGISIVFFLIFPRTGSIPGGGWTIAAMPIAGVVGGIVAIFVLRKGRLFWRALALRWKVLSIVGSSAAYITICLLVNRHKPDAEFQDIICCSFLAMVLALLGLYSLMSRGLDALWGFIKEHK